MVLLPIALILVQDEINLQPRLPKAGSIAEYALVYRNKSSFTSDEFHSKRREKVLGVRSDGSYVLRTESLGGYAILKGTRIRLKPEPATLTNFDPLGRREKRDKPLVVTEPMAKVAYGVTQFHSPSKLLRVGDQFGKILNSNDGEGYNDATLRYEVVGKEKWRGHDVMRISFTYQEKFAKTYFEGYWLLRVKDARVVAFRAEGTDVPYVLNLPAGEATITLDLLSER